MLKKLKLMWKVRQKRAETYSRPEYWNYKASEYSGTAVSMFVNKTLNESFQNDQFRFFDEELGNVQGKRVLDLGCGTGRLSRHLAKRGAAVVGIDFSVASVDLAREQSKGLNVEFKSASVFELNDCDEYEAIAVLGCLTVACKNREDFIKVAQSLFRATKQGGRLVMVEPLHANFLRRVLSLSAADAISDMEAAGFKLQRFKELHFWPTRLLLTLGDAPSWITVPVNFMGECMMRIPIPGRGDYKCMSFVKSSA
jgi:2-polyprenyl-3-methyl-5-hydroxy-6-metoxy-1,4-benzoquinol methylase